MDVTIAFRIVRIVSKTEITVGSLILANIFLHFLTLSITVADPVPVTIASVSTNPSSILLPQEQDI